MNLGAFASKVRIPSINKFKLGVVSIPENLLSKASHQVDDRDGDQVWPSMQRLMLQNGDLVEKTDSLDMKIAVFHQDQNPVVGARSL